MVKLVLDGCKETFKKVSSKNKTEWRKIIFKKKFHQKAVLAKRKKSLKKCERKKRCKKRRFVFISFQKELSKYF
jgi:hypothetical protein